MDKSKFINYLNDYISGNITNPRLKEELENNKIFMEAVMKLTKIENYFRSCSIDLKRDYGFICDLLNDFDDNPNAKCYFISQYLFETLDLYDINSLKLMAKLQNICEDSSNKIDSSCYINYQTWFNKYMLRIVDNIEYIKLNGNNNDGMYNSIGFDEIVNKYRNYSDIVNFYAFSTTKILLNDKSLLEYIFNNFTKEQFLQSDNNHILIDYINCFDMSLSSYYINNNEELKKHIGRIIDIKKNYDMVKKEYYNPKIREFNNNLNLFLEENNIEYTYKVDLIKIEELKRLHLEKLFYDDSNLETDFLNRDKNMVDFNLEKVRFFVKNELKRLFKTKRM